jgi:dCMP deaminase
MHIKPAHLQARLHQALALAQLSTCPRRKVAALIIDPRSMSIISDGYNGPPRKGPALCGEDLCLRDALNIASGEQPSTGCYHAEANAVLNAARQGSSTLHTLMICTTAPCEACAKIIYHAGIKALYIPSENYSTSSGVEFLREYGVEVLSITNGYR